MKGKLNEIEVLASEYDILCITETHIDSSFNNEMILSSSQKCIYRCDRDCHGGGVMIALSPCINHHQIHLEGTYFPIEVICVKIECVDSGLDLIILCLYIPPSFIRQTIDPLDDLLGQVVSRFPKSTIFVSGDFNLPDIDWIIGQVRSGSHNKTLHKSFLSSLLSHHLTQLVTEPTHQLGNTLDLILTNNDSLFTDLNVINPGLSDHYMVGINIKNREFRPNSKHNDSFKIYAKANFEAITLALEKTLSKVSSAIQNEENINTTWQIFETDLKEAVSNYVPKCTKKIRNKDEPVWFNDSARKCVRSQRKLYDKFKKSGLDTDLQQYKQARRQNKKLFRKMEYDHYDRILFKPLSLGDSKPFYSFYRRKSGKSCHGSVIFKGKSAFETSEIFNKYFQSVFSGSSSYSDPLWAEGNCPITITSEGVRKLLIGLKTGKAPGPDQLRKEDLSLDVVVTSQILALIFQHSLNTGQLPDIWKAANVVPIFKKGSRDSPSNFRPVSLTCIACKLLEHIVLSNINQHLNVTLNPNQHGFRQGLSCTTQLVTTVDDIMKMVDGNDSVHAAVLDFSKAFDRVPHGLLIEKLLFIGIDSAVVRWIAHFLADRMQKVVVEGATSGSLAVTSGVPQGSVLGPSLFLVYINDICSIIKTSTIRLFADDALLYCPVNSLDSSQKFQEDLFLLERWAEHWGMVFNTDKCQIVRFGKNGLDSSVDYFLGGVALENVSAFKYLGVEITSDFSWDLQIDSVTAKASRRLGMMRHVLFKAPRKVKRVAYLTLCRPIMEYAGEVWDPHLVRQITSLENVQRRAVRFISDLRGKRSVTEARQFLDLELLEARRKSARMTLMLEILADSRHSSFVDSFKHLQDTTHDHNTRSTTNGEPPAIESNSSFYQYSFMPRTSRNLRGKP